MATRPKPDDIQRLTAARLLRELAEAFLERGWPGEAEELLRESIRLDPTNGQTLLDLAEIRRRQGRDSEAGDVADDAFLIDPELTGSTEGDRVTL
jgi:Flp pilus assembly protein TadD